MKKRILCTSVLAVTLLLNGCATAASQPENTISNQDFSSLHEQLETLQTDVSHYINTPSPSDYQMLTEQEMKTSLGALSSELLLQLDNLTDVSYREVNIAIIFYDKENNLLDNATCYVDHILAGKSYYTSVYCPTDAENNLLEYDHYELQVKALPMEGEVTDYSDQVYVTSNPMAGQGIIAKFSNDSDEILNNIAVYLLYEDAEGNTIDCETYTIYNLLPESFEAATFSSPYDTNYESVPYENYTLVVASAINTDNQFPGSPQPRPAAD